MCLCSEVERQHNLPTNDEEALRLKSALDAHLDALHTLILKSKSLSRALCFQLRRKKPASETVQTKIAKIFNTAFDHTGQRQVLDSAKRQPHAFWTPPKAEWNPTNERQVSLLRDPVYSLLNHFLRHDRQEAHQILLRRLGCIVVYLLSQVIPLRYNAELIASDLIGVGLFDLSKDALQSDIFRICDAGKRYLDVCPQLGGIGAVWWLPLEVGRQGWEKYLPKTGQVFESVISQLQQNGIARLSSLSGSLVERLIFIRIQPILPNISLIKQYLPSSQSELTDGSESSVPAPYTEELNDERSANLAEGLIRNKEPPRRPQIEENNSPLTGADDNQQPRPVQDTDNVQRDESTIHPQHLQKRRRVTSVTTDDIGERQWSRNAVTAGSPADLRSGNTGPNVMACHQSTLEPPQEPVEGNSLPRTEAVTTDPLVTNLCSRTFDEPGPGSSVPDPEDHSQAATIAHMVLDASVCYVLPSTTLRQLVTFYDTEIQRIRFTHSVPNSKSFVTFNVSQNIVEQVSREFPPQEYGPCNIDTAAKPTLASIVEISISDFAMLLQHDGFGSVWLTKSLDLSFITIQVTTEDLIASFIACGIVM